MKEKNLLYIINLILCFSIVYLYSCKNESGDLNVTDNQVIVDDTLKSEQGSSGVVTKIFYNVPSPIEMAGLMQRAGSFYQGDLLNPVKNSEKYITVSSQALNLGIFGADLSYTRIFDQIQESMNYLTAIKKLSDALGIPRVEGAMTINKLEENIDNRDSLLYIISDTYSNADLYLKENNRGSTAAKIIFGGWIEALYIATHIINEKKPNREIMERIAEQKYSLNNLMELLLIYKDKEDVLQHIADLEELKKIFDAIKIVHTSKEPDTDVHKKMTTINNLTEVTVTMNDIKNISNKVEIIRNKIVK